MVPKKDTSNMIWTSKLGHGFHGFHGFHGYVKIPESNRQKDAEKYHLPQVAMNDFSLFGGYYMWEINSIFSMKDMIMIHEQKDM